MQGKYAVDSCLSSLHVYIAKIVPHLTEEPFIPCKLPQYFSIPLKSLHAFGNILADCIALETLMVMPSQ